MPWLLALVVLVLFFAILRSLILVVEVEHFSMTPTLNDGDRKFAIRMLPLMKIHVDDIVVLQPKHRSNLEFDKRWEHFVGRTLIKRVVKLSGEEAYEVVESRVGGKRSYFDIPAYRRNVIVPQGHVFVRSDNHLSMFDSRTLGSVPSRFVFAKLLIRHAAPENLCPPEQFQGDCRAGSSSLKKRG
jgi:signal peptidase I